MSTVAECFGFPRLSIVLLDNVASQVSTVSKIPKFRAAYSASCGVIFSRVWQLAMVSPCSIRRGTSFSIAAEHCLLTSVAISDPLHASRRSKSMVKMGNIPRNDS